MPSGRRFKIKANCGPKTLRRIEYLCQRASELERTQKASLPRDVHGLDKDRVVEQLAQRVPEVRSRLSAAIRSRDVVDLSEAIKQAKVLEMQLAKMRDRRSSMAS